MPNELLDPRFWTVRDLFKYRFVVPVYQRPYSWEEQQIKCLLNDIWESYEKYLKLSEEDKKRHSLYLGNVIIHEKKHEFYNIIDGQQRITTFSIMLLSLYAKLFELNCDNNHKILIKLKQTLWKPDNLDEPVKEQVLIELGNIDKQILKDIFEEAFVNTKELEKYVSNYIVSSLSEKNVKENFIRIYSFITNKFKDDLEKVLLFINFILTKIYLITIINKNSEIDAFSIFESINSKGKKLDDIDLIKTRIFSTFNEIEATSYLAKWGTLIKSTNDKLYEYLIIFIKANIRYYQGNITFKYFESESMDKDLCSFFNTEKLSEAYKNLIDTMIKNIDCFNALFYFNSVEKLINNNKFKFYYSLFVRVKYEHPRPLFYRCFCDLKDGKIEKSDVVEIIIEIIKFSVSFLTISGKDSKDSISLFSDIFRNIYHSNKINKDLIIYHINVKLNKLGVRKEDLFENLIKLDVFGKNKILGYFIVSVYETIYEKNGISQISWDEAVANFNNFGKVYSLDHKMVQTPKPDDKQLKYYKLGDNLKLKKGHDFPVDIVHEGMNYEDFKSLILHRIGNLFLKGKDANSSKGNNSESDFNKYLDIDNRSKKISKFFINEVLNFSEPSKNFEQEKENFNIRKSLTGNINFSIGKNISLTKTKPEGITINGKTISIKYNKDIIKQIVLYLYSLDKMKLINLSKNKYAPKQRILLSCKKEDLTAPFEVLKNTIYLETNLSANNIFMYSKTLLDEFNVPNDDISIYIPEK